MRNRGRHDMSRAAAAVAGARLVAHEARAGGDPTDLAQLFERRGTLLRLTPQQQITCEATTACSYMVRSGTVALESSLPPRHIVGLWHAGDLLDGAHLPALPHLSIRALCASELSRLRHAPAVLDDEGPGMAQAYVQHCAAMLRRLMVTNALLALPTAEERLISFLVSSAARLGQRAGHRVEMRTPWSRVDLAAHLNLNPDTLSRIMTRLQADGLIEAHGRHTLVVRDWAALCDRTPLVQALVD